MHWIGICVLCFLIGRAVQRWCDDAPDLEHGLYEAGYNACLRDNTLNFWETFAYTEAEMARSIAEVTSNAPTDV